MSLTICPECKENRVEDHNMPVPGICDSCQEEWEPNDYEGDL